MTDDEITEADVDEGMTTGEESPAEVVSTTKVDVQTSRPTSRVADVATSSTRGTAEVDELIEDGLALQEEIAEIRRVPSSTFTSLEDFEAGESEPTEEDAGMDDDPPGGEG